MRCMGPFPSSSRLVGVDAGDFDDLAQPRKQGIVAAQVGVLWVVLRREAGTIAPQAEFNAEIHVVIFLDIKLAQGAVLIIERGAPAIVDLAAFVRIESAEQERLAVAGLQVGHRHADLHALLAAPARAAVAHCNLPEALQLHPVVERHRRAATGRPRKAPRAEQVLGINPTMTLSAPYMPKSATVVRCEKPRAGPATLTSSKARACCAAPRSSAGKQAKRRMSRSCRFFRGPISRRYGLDASIEAQLAARRAPRACKADAPRPPCRPRARRVGCQAGVLPRQFRC